MSDSVSFRASYILRERVVRSVLPALIQLKLPAAASAPPTHAHVPLAYNSVGDRKSSTLESFKRAYYADVKTPAPIASIPSDTTAGSSAHLNASSVPCAYKDLGAQRNQANEDDQDASFAPPTTNVDLAGLSSGFPTAISRQAYLLATGARPLSFSSSSAPSTVGLPSEFNERAQRCIDEDHAVRRIAWNQLVESMKSAISECVADLILHVKRGSEQEFVCRRHGTPMKRASQLGYAGGDKYIHEEFFIKFAKDPAIPGSNHRFLYGAYHRNDRLANKALGTELRAYNALLLNTEICKEWHFPLCMTVTYLGQRVLVSSLLPIGKIQGCADSTLIQGSTNAMQGKLALPRKQENVHQLDSFARNLNLAPYELSGGGICYAPWDVEFHLGHDGRLYVIDVARLFPNAVEKDEIDKASSFRPEFIQLYHERLCPEPLLQDLDHMKRVKSQLTEATQFLFETTIPRCASKLMEEFTQNPQELRDNLKRSMHRLGVNMRYTGRVYRALSRLACLDSKKIELLRVILAESVARAFRTILESQWRDLKDSDVNKYGLCARELFQSFLQNDVGLVQQVRDLLLCHFRFSEEDVPGFSLEGLRQSDVGFFLLDRIQQLTGVTIENSSSSLSTESKIGDLARTQYQLQMKPVIKIMEIPPEMPSTEEALRARQAAYDRAKATADPLHLTHMQLTLARCHYALLKDSRTQLQVRDQELHFEAAHVLLKSALATITDHQTRGNKTTSSTTISPSFFKAESLIIQKLPILECLVSLLQLFPDKYHQELNEYKMQSLEELREMLAILPSDTSPDQPSFAHNSSSLLRSSFVFERDSDVIWGQAAPQIGMVQSIANYLLHSGADQKSVWPILVKLGDLLRENSRFDESLHCLFLALKMADQEDYELLRRERKYEKLLNNIASALRYQEHLDRASEFAMKALNMLPDEPAFLESKGDSYNNLGNILINKGDSTGACDHYCNALHAFQQLSDSTRSASFQLRPLLNMADMHMIYNELEAAEAKLTEAEKLLALLPSGEYSQVRAWAADYRGKLLALMNRAPEALLKCREAMQIYDRLAPGSNLAHIARVNKHLGSIFLRLNNPQEAASYLHAALNGMKQVYPNTHRELGLVCIHLSELSYAQQDLKAALAHCNEALMHYRYTDEADLPPTDNRRWIREALQWRRMLSEERGLQVAGRLQVTRVTDLKSCVMEGEFPGEDVGLGFDIPHSERRHYYSAVWVLPAHVQHQLFACISQIYGHLPAFYYHPPAEHLHCTMVSDFFRGFEQPTEEEQREKFSELELAIADWRKNHPELANQPLQLELTKVTISKASINCELHAYGDPMQSFYDYLAARFPPQRELKNQSITMIRFRLPSNCREEAKRQICDHLDQLENSHLSFAAGRVLQRGAGIEPRFTCDSSVVVPSHSTVFTVSELFLIHTDRLCSQEAWRVIQRVPLS